MGVTGTEIAKEASDIILMDDNFSSIVKAIMWGRCVNDAVRKFLQFQLTTNVTAVIITFVTTLASSGEEGALSAVQLLWINLIMDTFAALALATDPASPVLLNRKPDKKTDPLFTVDMLKQILGQSVYQIVVILIFHFLGSRILGFEHSDDSSVQKHNNTVIQTLVFNAYVFAQITNSLNCRRLDRKLNVFEGMLKNWYFLVITFIGSSFLLGIGLCLNSPNRVYCSSHNLLRRWLRVSGHPHGRERMGHLSCSRLHVASSRRSHPSCSKRALQAHLLEATASP
jgi:Ca2+-transporting ATPase